jgi:hypothetical protein
VCFRSFWSFSLGSQSALLPSRLYFRVCVLVAVFVSTETSLATIRGIPVNGSQHCASSLHPSPSKMPRYQRECEETLCCAIALPGSKSGSRAELRLDSCRESFRIGSPAGRRLVGGPILRFSPAEIRPGNTISGPEALLRSIGYTWAGALAFVFCSGSKRPWPTARFLLGVVRTGARRFWVAFRTNPTRGGGPGKGPDRGSLRFTPMFRPVD